MCFQLIELYSACHCLYYQRAVDRCASYGRPGHNVEQRAIYVGYACASHADRKIATDDAVTTESIPPSQAHDEPKPDHSDPDDGGDVISCFEEASVFSANTHASTSATDLGDIQVRSLADALFKDLLHDPVLCHLWPQILRLSKSRTRAKVSIERLLRRYAFDLRQHASTQIERDAARLVRWARLDIAQRLTEAHLLENPNEEPAELFHTTGPHVQLEPEEEVDNFYIDVNELAARVKYESARGVLFETETFETFKSNVKTFVRLKKPSFTRKPWYGGAVAYLGRQIHWFIGSYLEPPLPHSTARVRWTCVSASTRLSIPGSLVTLELTRSSIVATRHSTMSTSPTVGVLLSWKSSWRIILPWGQNFPRVWGWRWWTTADLRMGQLKMPIQPKAFIKQSKKCS